MGSSEETARGASMIWTIVLSSNAKKQLEKIPKNERERLLTAIDMLVYGIKESGLDIKKLLGRPEWRIRLGGWRVLFTIDSDKIVITVISIASRGDVYKK